MVVSLERNSLEQLAEKWFRLKDGTIGEKVLFQYLIHRTGIERRTFDKARNCLKNRESSFSTVQLSLLQIAEIIERIPQFTKEFEIEELLREYALPGFVMTSERAANFSLQRLQTYYDFDISYEKDYGNSFVHVERGAFKRFNIYLDTPASMGLFHHGEPRALISVLPQSRTELRIHQLQGVRIEYSPSFEYPHSRPKSRGGGCLGTLDWKKFLVSCAEQFALRSNFEEVSILSVKNNKWFTYGKLKKEKGFSIYDATAEQLGYLQKEDGNWYKHLSQ